MGLEEKERKMLQLEVRSNNKRRTQLSAVSAHFQDEFFFWSI